MEAPRVVRAEKPHHLRDAHKVRTLVFQMEQNMPPALDFDKVDKHMDTLHFVAYSRHDGHDHPVGTARVRLLDDRVRAKIERVAVLSTERGRNVGARIMEYVETFLSELEIPEVFLDAKESAWGFYKKLGYVQEGDVFDEAGIPHMKMVKLSVL